MQRVWTRTSPLSRTVGAVVIVALAATAIWWFGIRDASAATSEPVTRTVAASLTTMEKSVSASGTLTPSVQEDVSFDVSGTVTSVPVAVGQTVTVGQTLATVDTLELQASLLQAKATLASAQAKLSDAEDAADGTDASDAKIAAAQAQVDVAQSGVDTAQTAMAGATLTAPVAGMLTVVGLEVGDAVGSSASSAPGGTSTGSSTTTAQFTIVSTANWEVDVTVSDADVALVAVGDQAEVTLDGATTPVFGTISAIGLLSTSDSGVAAYPVTVAVTGDQEGLHDGVSADVALVYERRTDVLTIPSLAVTTADGKSTVKVQATDGTITTVDVTVGETSDNLTEITKGLSEGDEVVLATFTPGTGGTGRDTQQQGGTGGQLPEGFPEGFTPPEGFTGGPQGGGTNG